MSTFSKVSTEERPFQAEEECESTLGFPESALGFPESALGIEITTPPRPLQPGVSDAILLGVDAEGDEYTEGESDDEQMEEDEEEEEDDDDEEEEAFDPSKLIVHVMLPTNDETFEDDDDAIHRGQPVGELSLDKSDVGSVLELRAAVRQALEEKPAIADAVAAYGVEPSIWYGRANGINTVMLVGYARLDAVLSAERVWFSPPRRSTRPHLEQRPHEIAKGLMSARAQQRHRSLFGQDIDSGVSSRQQDNHAFLD
jgi:hypothetical protein